MNLKRTKAIYNEETQNYDIVELELTEEQYQEELQILSAYQINQIRALRDECFRIVNRGEVWYSILTEQQKIELKQWYLEWLDAPKTKIIPKKPIWIKE